MNYDKLLESVKKHEGFRDTVYLDTLNKRTVGFGHLCVEDHWEDGKKYDKEYLIKNVSKGISQDIWYFINDKLENEWCEFHLKESTLRLLCKPCNDKKTYKRKAA